MEAGCEVINSLTPNPIPIQKEVHYVITTEPIEYTVPAFIVDPPHCTVTYMH